MWVQRLLVEILRRGETAPQDDITQTLPVLPGGYSANCGFLETDY
jgi:hypothetical protein